MVGGERMGDARSTKYVLDGDIPTPDGESIEEHGKRIGTRSEAVRGVHVLVKYAYVFVRQPIQEAPFFLQLSTLQRQ